MAMPCATTAAAAARLPARGEQEVWSTLASEQVLPLRRGVSKARSEAGGSEASTAAADSDSERAPSSPTTSEASSLLSGRVWQLSQDREGCREVQEAFDAASSDEAREALARELHGRVAKAMRHPHANHVLQKCISVLPAEALQFMVDELMVSEDFLTSAARHRYACRVVQQLLRKCSAAQASGLVEVLLQRALELSCHSFGTYVVQHLLQFGTAEQQYRLVRMIERNTGVLCRCTPGSGVVAAAMEHAAPEDRIWICRAVLQEPELLTSMAQTGLGSGAVVRMLQLLGDCERTSACDILLEDMVNLRASQHGSVVAEYLEAQAQLRAM